MAENPSPSPQNPLQPPPPTSDAQNPNLLSPQIPPSPSIDLPQISSPQPPIHQTLMMSPSSSSSSSNFQMNPNNGNTLPRSGSVPRLSQIQQQYGAAAAAAAAGAMRQHGGLYGGATQMSFCGPPISRPGMIGQAGQIPGMIGQSAAQFNLQQMGGGVPRQKAGLVQGAGQTLQGMQAIGMMNSLGLASQMRANGPLSYQQRFNPGQSRQQPQLSPQTSLPSPQKLQSQSLPRASSLAAMSAHLSGLTQNGQSALVQSLTQQQWLKQMQPGMAAPISPSYNLQQQQQQHRQHQSLLQQQLSSPQLHQKSMGLNQQQISQLLQHQAQMGTPQLQQSQHLMQQQQLQQQQQQSPRMLGSAVQKSLSLMGSQPDTPASGTTGGSSSQGTEATHQLLGKRKIQDLVSQVDSLGKLDPDVEDLLLEIADDFINSVTTFACNLAKHRKSSTLESKDMLLHLEKNWSLKVPGYTREEQKRQRISLCGDTNQKRLEMVRTLMDSQQERDRNAAKGSSSNQAVSNSAIDHHPIRPSPSSEKLALNSAASQMMHKVPRF